MILQLRAYERDTSRLIDKQDVEVKSFEQAQQTLEKWEDENGYGGSQVGHIKLLEGKKLVAYLSYNCRVWSTEKNWENRKVLLENKYRSNAA